MLPPHTRIAVEHLGLIHRILDVEPPPVISSASRGAQQVLAVQPGWLAAVPAANFGSTVSTVVLSLLTTHQAADCPRSTRAEQHCRAAERFMLSCQAAM